MFDREIGLEAFDKDIWQAIQKESIRQEEHIELIASENYASPLVMQVQGSLLTNKYAEGYPHKRYYGGCEFVDMAESIAIERAKALFKCDYANVQPHSGSQANAAAFLALLSPGDTVLAMSLPEGGHLTHGSKVNFSGKIYNFVHYGVEPDTHLIDYKQIQNLAEVHRPKMIIAGFSAYSRVLDFDKFREIADQVGAYLLVDMAHIAGLVACDEYPSPLPYADVVTTTTHKTLRGPRGGMILSHGKPDIAKKLNSAMFPGTQGGPLMHIIAAKAIAFKEAMSDNFKQYQQQVKANAKHMAAQLIVRGYDIVSGGTDNHLFLLSLINKQMTGKLADMALGQANITVNKNTVPNDPNSPFVTSGLRLGTPAITTRGFGQQEVELLSNWIADILDAPEDEQIRKVTQKKVVELCHEYPVYGTRG